MADIAAYSFKHLACLVGGVPVGGFADGDDAIRAQRSVESLDLTVGAGGDVIGVVNADRTGRITLKLLQTSESNGYLSGLLALQEQLGRFQAVPIVVKDLLGADVIVAEKCFLAGPPEMVYGVGGNAREWVFKCAELDIAAGGTLPA